MSDRAWPGWARPRIVLAPAALVFALALFVALFAPLPAWIDEPLDADDAMTSATRVEAGTPSGLALTDHDGTLEISVADGGGCGAIDGFEGDGDLALAPARFRGREAFAVGRFGRAPIAYVDSDGVRLDDTLTDRTRERASVPVLALLAAAASLLIVLRRDRPSDAKRAFMLGAAAAASLFAAAALLFSSV